MKEMSIERLHRVTEAIVKKKGLTGMFHHDFVSL